MNSISQHGITTSNYLRPNPSVLAAIRHSHLLPLHASIPAYKHHCQYYSLPLFCVAQILAWFSSLPTDVAPKQFIVRHHPRRVVVRLRSSQVETVAIYHRQCPRGALPMTVARPRRAHGANVSLHCQVSHCMLQCIVLPCS